MLQSTAPEADEPPERQGAAAARLGYARWVLTGLLCLMALLAVGAALYRGSFLIELNINEGWNAYYAQALLRGQPLYPPASALITNNYPPLAFLPVAGLALITHDPLFAGRALSVISLAVLSGCVYAILRRLEARPWPAFVAAAAFLATMSRLFDNHVAVNDPQLFSNALSALGFLAFLRARARNAHWYAAPAALFVSACFVKPTELALPASAFLVLALEAPRAAGRMALIGIVLGLAGLALCRLAFGPNVLPDILAARPYFLARGLKALEDLHRDVVQLLAWLICLATTKDGVRRRLINILCVLALAQSFVFRGAAQVYYNVGFDLVFALNLALGVALDQFVQLSPRLRRPAIGLAELAVIGLLLRLPFGERHDAFQAIYDPAWRQGLHRAEAATRADAALVGRLKGPVFCESTLICYLAGKPFVVDPVNVPLRIASGALPADALQRLYRARQLTFIPSDPVAAFARH